MRGKCKKDLHLTIFKFLKKFCDYWPEKLFETGIGESENKEKIIVEMLPFSSEWTTLPKEAASLLWYFYRDPLGPLPLLSLNVSSQKS